MSTPKFTPPATTPPTTNAIPMGHASAAPQPLGEIRTSGKAIASLVCGIISILLGIGIVLGPIAIILGVLAKNEINHNPRGIQGKCQATAGVVCGSISIILSIVVIIIVLSPQ